MATITGYSESGLTVKAVIRDGAMQFANTSTEAMESYNAANIDNYAIDCAEIGNTGEYFAAWPAWLAVGSYTVQMMSLAGGAITEGDFINRFGVRSWYWDGANLVPDWAVKLAVSGSPVENSLEYRVDAKVTDRTLLAEGYATAASQATMQVTLESVETVASGLNDLGDDDVLDQVAAGLQAVHLDSLMHADGTRLADGMITNDSIATDAINSGKVATTATQEIAAMVRSYLFLDPTAQLHVDEDGAVLASYEEEGTGSVSHTLSFATGGVPADGVEVKIYTDEACTAKAAGPRYTNAFGEVTFQLDPTDEGQYYYALGQLANCHFPVQAFQVEAES